MKKKSTKLKILEALEDKEQIKKYKLVVEFTTDEKINIRDILEGGWLYDEMFSGAITSSKLKEIK